VKNSIDYKRLSFYVEKAPFTAPERRLL